jgi:hypothetical protein
MHEGEVFMRFNCLRLFLLAFVASFASGSGCDSNDVGGVVLPPLRIRSTFPVDEVRLFEAGQDSILFNLSVVFVRRSNRSDVVFRLFPSPLSSGLVAPSGLDPEAGRNWTWNDVWFSTAQGAYFWLIDGPDVPFPKVVRLVTGSIVGSSVGFSGTLTSSNAATLPLDGALVFALPTTSGFNPLDPASFNIIEPAAVAEIDSVGLAGERPFHTSYMPFLMPYYVVAILDINDDAVYDPTVDAWGYREDPGGGPEAILTDVPPLLDANEYRSDVDFTIFPAAVMKQRAAAARSR